jgi:hypothetical protein
MTYTHEDVLTKLWLPAARAMRPAEQVMQSKAVRRAVTDDGYIDPIAILPGSTVDVRFGSASTTASSSDTVNYTAYLTHTVHLQEGVWRLLTEGALCGRLSGASTFNSQISLNGNAGSNYQIPLAAGDMGVTFPFHELTEVSGDVLLEVMFRPTAGTLTIESGRWLYRAERIR